MVYRQIGEIVEVTSEMSGVQQLVVRLSDGSHVGAVAFRDLVGPCQPGDVVALNCTARALALGSGGWDFVMANLSHSPAGDRQARQDRAGHLIKLRYTPSQMAILAWDEEDSPVRPANPRSYGQLAGTPVLIAGVHSLVEPTARAVGTLVPGARIAYVQTDAACLPVEWSQTVAKLKAEGVVTATITSGHAFGGDYEALNNYSALACAKEVVRAEYILVCMGPGIPGTGTKYGSTAIEVGELVNVAAALGGQPIAVPRLGFADSRPRHQGISHHFVTALRVAAYASAQIAFPYFTQTQRHLFEQLADQAGLTQPNQNGAMHRLSFHDVTEITQRLEPYLSAFRSMGRSFNQDPLHFAAGFAAGYCAVSSCSKVQSTP